MLNEFEFFICYNRNTNGLSQLKIITLTESDLLIMQFWFFFIILTVNNFENAVRKLLNIIKAKLAKKLETLLATIIIYSDMILVMEKYKIER